MEYLLGLPWARHLVGKRKQLPARDIALHHGVLVVLPHEPEAAGCAWRFVEALRVPSHCLTVVTFESGAREVPTQFINQTYRLRSRDIARIGVPKLSFMRRVWKTQPRFAVDLNSPFYLSGGLLVGASPAKLRIGFFDPRAEPFFDCMIKLSHPAKQAVSVMTDYLRLVEPALMDN